jgi:hypothetical protein
MESSSPRSTVASPMTRIRLIASLVILGGAMIAAGWVVEDEGYISALLLQLGSTVLLIAPLVYVERHITRQLDEVRDDLEDLQRQADAVATPYEQLRADKETGRERTAEMERQMARARADARRGGHDRGDVAALFSSGSDGERIYALGLMQGRHSLTSSDAIVDGILRSRSAFEQYQALLLAQRAWRSLKRQEQQRVLEAINAEMQPGRHIQHGTDRYELARAIRLRVRGA